MILSNSRINQLQQSSENIGVQNFAPLVVQQPGSPLCISHKRFKALNPNSTVVPLRQKSFEM
jgi:hypothetical protein